MKVLLIEDNPILGEALRDHVLASGYDVDWRMNFADGMSASLSNGYDLILLDLRLPDGDGLGILRFMTQKRSVSPTIIMTAYDQVSDLMEGLRSGASDYLVKPFNLSELTLRMERAHIRRVIGAENPWIRHLERVMAIPPAVSC